MNKLQFDIAFTHATLLTGEVQPSAVDTLSDMTLAVANGRIAWIGKGLPEGARCTRTIDATGKVITPGFVNVHTHSILTMVRGVAADLGFAPSYTPGIPKGTQVTPDQARVLAKLGALEALMFGSTLVGDNFVCADVTTEAMVALGMRLTPSWRIHDVDFSKVSDGKWEYSAAIGESTLKAGLALAGRWKDHPLVNVQLAAHAVDTCSDGFLREIASVSAQQGLRVNTHLGQSKIEVERVLARTGKTSAQVLSDVGLLNDRLLAGHCIYVSDSDIALLAKAGAHAVHIPKCNATSGRLAPTPALKQAGVNIALATDTQHGDMVELMRWALMTARVQQGGVNDEWQPKHVFEMATMGGARAVGMADRLGSLEVGKLADLVLFDFRRPHLTPRVNPLGTLVHTGQGRDVELVMVNGVVLVEHGLPTQVDMAQICAEAEAVCRDLWRNV